MVIRNSSYHLLQPNNFTDYKTLFWLYSITLIVLLDFLKVRVCACVCRWCAVCSTGKNWGRTDWQKSSWRKSLFTSSLKVRNNKLPQCTSVPCDLWLVNDVIPFFVFVFFSFLKPTTAVHRDVVVSCVFLHVRKQVLGMGTFQTIHNTEKKIGTVWFEMMWIKWMMTYWKETDATSERLAEKY